MSVFNSPKMGNSSGMDGHVPHLLDSRIELLRKTYLKANYSNAERKVHFYNCGFAIVEKNKDSMEGRSICPFS